MDYSCRDIKVFLDFSKHLSEGEEDGNRNPSRNYDARLLYNHRTPQYIELDIFYENKYHVLERFKHLKENGENILSIIKKENPDTHWENPDELDLSNSQLIEFRDNHGWEQRKRVVEIFIDNVDVFDHGTYVDHGLFFLTENAIRHIGEYLTYSSLRRDDWDYRLINSDNNRETQFGKFRFILKLKHSHGNGDKFNIIIARFPLLQVNTLDGKIDNFEILEFGRLMCILMSFLWNKSIDFFKGYARVINKPNIHTHHFFRYSKWQIDEEIKYPLKEKYSSFYDFVNSLDYTKVQSCSSLLYNIIPRIIQSKHSDEISEFMLLYNIIEKIRFFCMEEPINGEKFLITEEYKFKVSNRKRDQTIKQKLKDIKDIVDDSDIDNYISNVPNKVNFIKKTGLIDQFDSLVSYLGLNLDAYGIDFKKLIKNRNNIYHGKSPCDDVNLYNKNMKLLINDLILKLIQ